MYIGLVSASGFRAALLLAVLVLAATRSDAQQAAALRAGVPALASVDSLAAAQRTDSVANGHGSRRSHIAIGVGIGGLLGGVLGGLSARNGDTGTPYVDTVARAGSVVVGALLGALCGGVIGALVPHS